MIDRYGNDIEWVPNIQTSDIPYYKQIAQAIEEDIQEGRLLHGAKMPPQRVIANYLGINHGTVTKAYKLCEEKGLLKGIIGKGTFVSGSAGLSVDMLVDHDDTNIISLGMALPLYEANDLIATMIKEVIGTMDYQIGLKYCPAEGHLKHRYIAANWLRQHILPVEGEDLLITSGTQNALSVILVTLFNKGDRLIVDAYTYSGLITLAKYLGIILVPVPMNDDGMDLACLMTTLKRDDCKGIYLMPDCHNPTSIMMSDAKRRAIAEIIKTHKLLLIEDGTCSFLTRNHLKPVTAYVRDQGFYIHGTSKAISPAMRLSYLVAPKAYQGQLINGLNNLTWMASPFTAEIMSLLQATGKYDRIVEKKLAMLTERNQIFDDFFTDMETIPCQVGLFRHLSLKVPIPNIEEKALTLGLQVFDTKRFQVGIEGGPQAIRVAISSPKTKEALIEGLKTLRQLILTDTGSPLPIV